MSSKTCDTCSSVMECVIGSFYICRTCPPKQQTIEAKEPESTSEISKFSTGDIVKHKTITGSFSVLSKHYDSTYRCWFYDIANTYTVSMTVLGVREEFLSLINKYNLGHLLRVKTSGFVGRVAKVHKNKNKRYTYDLVDANSSNWVRDIKESDLTYHP